MRETAASDLLEIVLELHPRAEPAPSAASKTRSRGERIAAKKEALERNVAPVEEAIRKAGGDITGRAWINQTLRARVPPQPLNDLSEHEQVAALDIPHRITPDVGH